MARRVQASLNLRRRSWTEFNRMNSANTGGHARGLRLKFRKQLKVVIDFQLPSQFRASPVLEILRRQLDEEVPRIAEVSALAESSDLDEFLTPCGP